MTETPWAVRCPRHDLVYLTNTEYSAQVMNADSPWRCPNCGERADWDDSAYEKYMDGLSELQDDPEEALP